MRQLGSGSCRAALQCHGAQPNKQSRQRFINLTLISTAYYLRHSIMQAHSFWSRAVSSCFASSECDVEDPARVLLSSMAFCTGEEREFCGHWRSFCANKSTSKYLDCIAGICQVCKSFKILVPNFPMGV